MTEKDSKDLGLEPLKGTVNELRNGRAHACWVLHWRTYGLTALFGTFIGHPCAAMNKPLNV